MLILDAFMHLRKRLNKICFATGGDCRNCLTERIRRGNEVFGLNEVRKVISYWSRTDRLRVSRSLRKIDFQRKKDFQLKLREKWL